tara:strand:- start:1276 stop:2019 length:744 start_codon:yes stop_codon:yes gene_type:complete
LWNTKSDIDKICDDPSDTESGSGTQDTYVGGFVVYVVAENESDPATGSFAHWKHEAFADHATARLILIFINSIMSTPLIQPGFVGECCFCAHGGRDQVKKVLAGGVETKARNDRFSGNTVDDGVIVYMFHERDVGKKRSHCPHGQLILSGNITAVLCLLIGIEDALQRLWRQRLRNYFIKRHAHTLNFGFRPKAYEQGGIIPFTKHEVPLVLGAEPQKTPFLLLISGVSLQKCVGRGNQSGNSAGQE